MSVSSDAIKFVSDSQIDLEDGSTFWLERMVDGLVASHGFGAPGAWLTLCAADRLVYEGVVVDMTGEGWIGVLVGDPACLLVARTVSAQPEITLRVPLRREPSGDRAFRMLDFHVAGDFIVAQTEMVILVLDRSGSLLYAVPNTWPQTRIQALDGAHLELGNEWGNHSFGLDRGPALIAVPEADGR